MEESRRGPEGVPGGPWGGPWGVPGDPGGWTRRQDGSKIDLVTKLGAKLEPTWGHLGSEEGSWEPLGGLLGFYWGLLGLLGPLGVAKGPLGGPNQFPRVKS